MGKHNQLGEAPSGHPLENQPEAVVDAQEEATEEHKRTNGEAREPYAGTSPDSEKAWERATSSD